MNPLEFLFSLFCRKMDISRKCSSRKMLEMLRIAPPPVVEAEKEPGPESKAEGEERRRSEAPLDKTP